MTEQMERLIKLLKEMADGGLYGKITVKFENGIPRQVLKEESIKITT